MFGHVIVFIMRDFSASELVRLGQNIRRLRKGLAMNQVTLAQKADTRPGTISELENGLNKNPGWELLTRISSALDTTIHQLTMPDSSSTTVERANIIPNGLIKLVQEQDSFLLPAEDRISMAELECLKLLPVPQRDRMRPEAYLFVLRHLRLIASNPDFV